MQVVDEDLCENKSFFDFNDYPKDSGFYDSVNKKVIGKIKDEIWEKIISELIELKSKIYFLAMKDNERIKKAEGVNKNGVKSIRHKEYADVLFGRALVRHNNEEDSSGKLLIYVKKTKIPKWILEELPQVQVARLNTDHLEELFDVYWSINA